MKEAVNVSKDFLLKNAPEGSHAKQRSGYN